ncbi:hypothetical protein CDAR_507581 [Caerostris darwini]|uniref:Uncharacterized protein n=1 Tax=Caerostris darwini TaxID=1538125 RepID=A0AAV4MY20_9ARAC|nr:hypothetical protein CDAR_507581 [Caerostris darwini]
MDETECPSRRGVVQELAPLLLGPISIRSSSSPGHYVYLQRLSTHLGPFMARQIGGLFHYLFPAPFYRFPVTYPTLVYERVTPSPNLAPFLAPPNQSQTAMRNHFFIPLLFIKGGS